MGETLTELLIACQRDLNGLIHLKNYTENASRSKVSFTLRRHTLEAIKNLISVCTVQQMSDSAFAGIILDTFEYVIQNCDKGNWNKFSFDFGNLTLKILSCIEKSEKFQVLFCKLMSSTVEVCMRSSNAWRQLARPLLNVFINKNFDYVYMERALREFKNISKCCDSRELVSFTRQNQQLLREFSMLVRRVGDFLAQMDILELVLLYTADERSLIRGFFVSGCREVSELMEKLDFSHFERDSRLLLNVLNTTMGTEKRVFSVNCNLVYFGNLSLTAPHGMKGIWMDVNRDSRRMTISCADFLTDSASNRCIIMQLPLREVDGLDLEFGTLSGEKCYCFTLRIAKLEEMYQFANGQSIVCTALKEKNSQEDVLDFVRMAKELSGKIQGRAKENLSYLCESGKRQIGTSGHLRSTRKNAASCTSPTIFLPIKNENIQKAKSHVVSCTSPLIVLTDKTASCRRAQMKCILSEEKVYYAVGNKSVTSLANLQVHQISSSGMDSQKFLARSNFSSSWSSLSPQQERALENTPVQLKQIINEESRSTEKIKSSSSPIIGHLNKGEGSEGKPLKQNYVKEIQEDWISSCEDFIKTQEFKADDGNKEKEGDTKKPPARCSNVDGLKLNLNQRRKITSRGKRKNGNSEDAPKTSLLDPNGYAYKRWIMPPTSERSNFWLNKLREVKESICHAQNDVFHFSEGELSNESNFFLEQRSSKRTRLAGKRRISASRGKGNVQGKHFITTVKREYNTGSTSKLEAHANVGEKIDSEAKKVHVNCYETSGRSRQSDKTLSVGNCEPSVNFDSDAESETSDTGERAEDWSSRKFKIKTCSREKRSSPTSSANLIARKGGEAGNEDSMEKELMICDVADKLSTNFHDFLEHVRERQVKEMQSYAKTVEEMREPVARAEREFAKRRGRFETCIPYFSEGCSTSDLAEAFQTEMAKLLEKLAEMKKEVDDSRSSFGRFAGKLRDANARETENRVRSHLHELKMECIEECLTNRGNH